VYSFMEAVFCCIYVKFLILAHCDWNVNVVMFRVSSVVSVHFMELQTAALNI